MPQHIQHLQHQPERRHTQPPSLGVPTPPTTGPAYSPEALAALVNATAHATTRGGEPMKLLDAQGQSIQLASGMGGGALHPRTAAALQGAQGGMAGQALGQAASGTVGRQYPDMLKVSSAKPPLKSLGATGTAIFSGIITSEEYNPDFYWRDAVQIYEQMIRNDAQVFAAIQMLELPIRRATWSIEPATDSLVDKEIASFVETALFHDLRYQTASGRWLTQKWDDVLRHILMMFRFGFMPFEVCFRVDPGGWVKWSRFTPLLPRTIYRWWVGADNELAGVQQWTYKNYSYEYIDIPADKLLLFVHRQEGNNYEGVSVLRSAYKNWYYKDNFYKIEAVAIERNAISVPVIGLPENFTDSDIQAAQKITANLRANENLGVTLPPGWTFEYARNQQKYAAGTEQPIAHHDVMIARNILAQFINLGSTETGAFALDASQKATFLAALQAQAEYIEDVFNSDAIPRLVDYNYAGVSVYPRLKCSKVLAQDFDQIASAINKLASNVPKPYITPDPELEDFLRNELGLPSAPASVVQSYNPSQQSAEGQQEPGAGQPGTNAAGPQAGQAGLPSENETGDGGDDGGDGGGGGGGALSEVRLLRESLDAVMGLDAVSRGKRSREARESIKLFNPNHDPHTGQFAPGGMGGLHAATGHVHGATGGSIHGAGSRMAAHGHSTGGSGGAGSGGAGRPHPGHQWEARRQQAHDELRQAEQDHADADRRLKQATAEAGRAQVEHARAMDALDAAKRALRVDPGNAALRAEVDQRVRAAAQKSIEHDDARQAMADRERDLSDAAQNHRDAERMVHATERAVQTGEHPDDLFDHMDAHGQVMPFTDHDVFDAWNTGTANTGPQNTPGHGWTSTESRTADLGGQKYYLKRNEDVPGPTGQLLASSEGQARSESATVAGLRALGMGDLAPREAYHVVGSDGLHYSVISGEPGERLDRAAFDQATMSDVLDHARGEDLQRLVVGQYLLGVRDRHTGNLLYDAQTGGVKAIDFGLGLRENPHADQAAADRVLLLRQAAKRAGVDFMRMRVVNTLAPHVRLDPAMVHAALSHEPEVLKVLEDFGASRMAKSAARQRFAIVRALAAQHPQGMSVQDLLNAAGTAAY